MTLAYTDAELRMHQHQQLFMMMGEANFADLDNRHRARLERLLAEPTPIYDATRADFDLFVASALELANAGKSDDTALEESEPFGEIGYDRMTWISISGLVLALTFIAWVAANLGAI